MIPADPGDATGYYARDQIEAAVNARRSRPPRWWLAYWVAVGVWLGLWAALAGAAVVVGTVALAAEPAGTAEEQEPPAGWCRCPR